MRPTLFIPLLSAALISAQTQILCEQFENATTTSGKYTFLTDQWGLDDSGFQCMNVSLNDTNDSNATSFSATWQWAGVAKNATTVHAFPNVNLNSALLPIQLSNLSSLPLSLTWTLSPGDIDTTMTTLVTSASALEAIDAKADVALDMFLDIDAKSATSVTYASTEIMIWQAAYGGVAPIGFSTLTSSAPTLYVAGTKYTLSHGLNSNNQSVYTWYPSTNLTNLDGVDVSPLINYLWRKEYLEDSMYLGLVQWGSEAVHSAKGKNVTFYASNVAIDVVKGTPVAASGVSRMAPAVTGLMWIVLGVVVVFGIF